MEEQPAAMEEVPAQEQGWIAGIWGILLFIVLIGPIFGLFLWWVWAKSPLRLWFQVILSLIPIVILAIIL